VVGPSAVAASVGAVTAVAASVVVAAALAAAATAVAVAVGAAMAAVAAGTGNCQREAMSLSVATRLTYSDWWLPPLGLRG
jgi:hypothetical protein